MLDTFQVKIGGVTYILTLRLIIEKKTVKKWSVGQPQTHSLPPSLRTSF